MKIVRISSFIIGLFMMAQWVFFLLFGSVPELLTEPIEIAFHLAAEGLTAFLLIVTSIVLKSPTTQNRMMGIFAQGMLVYTVINSAGYFAQRGQWLFLMMFGGLLFLSLLNFYVLFKKQKDGMSF